jgi:hypothetical protein
LDSWILEKSNVNNWQKQDLWNGNKCPCLCNSFDDDHLPMKEKKRQQTTVKEIWRQKVRTKRSLPPLPLHCLFIYSLHSICMLTSWRWPASNDQKWWTS